MRLSTTFLLTTLAVVAGGTASEAAAKCVQTDLKGKWLTEIASEVACKMVIDSTGKFKDAPCRSSGGTKVATVSGKLSVSSACAVTGKMNYIQGDASMKITVDAKMNKSKEAVIGTAMSHGSEFTYKSYRQ